MEIKKETYTPKIGYKGFSKDLTGITFGKDITFEIGKVYYKENVTHPKLCSNDGYHYCDKLSDVFKHYPASKAYGNRFCEIEIMGSFTDDLKPDSDGKSVTTCFRILREIPSETIEKILENEKISKIESKMNLEQVQWLQTKYPTLHVGGSIGLFLHGLSLKRWEHSSRPDIDIISPYFIMFEGDSNVEVDYDSQKSSGNDFDETFTMYTDKETVKVDVCIDNKQRYEIIEYNGFKYKVSQLEKIMESKIKYALNGQNKHKNDLEELLGAKKRTPSQPVNIWEEMKSQENNKKYVL